VLKRLKSDEPNKLHSSRPDELYVLGADLTLFGQMIQQIASQEAEKMVENVMRRKIADMIVPEKKT
jgi:hypothetical protein